MLFLASEMSQNFTDCSTMLVFSFRNVAKLYGLCNNAFFDFQSVAELCGLHNNACFDFQNVAKLYGLRNNACFEGSEGRMPKNNDPRTKLGYDSS